MSISTQRTSSSRAQLRMAWRSDGTASPASTAACGQRLRRTPPCNKGRARTYTYNAARRSSPQRDDKKNELAATLFVPDYDISFRYTYCCDARARAPARPSSLLDLRCARAPNI